VIPVTDDRAIKLTTALYYTPSGRSIQAQGIEPDISVERVRVTAVQPRSQVTEADLKGHLKNRNGGEERGSENREVADTELLNKDSQLYEALNLLKGLSIFRNIKGSEAPKPQAHTPKERPVQEAKPQQLEPHSDHPGKA
jgi:carboxyl-terminal processing protease